MTQETDFFLKNEPFLVNSAKMFSAELIKDTK